MAEQTCPACQKHSPTLLEETSKDTMVNYYRCDCGHIWTVSKRSGKLVAHVTPLTRTRPDTQ
jgi:lysyl-tRNA synthetase class I